MTEEIDNPRKLPGRDQIEAFINQNNLITLKQENPMDNPSIIVMLPSDVPIVVKWLQDLAKEHSEQE